SLLRMDWFNSAFDAVLRFYFAAFSWAPPAVGLAVLSAAVGVGILWVFHKTSDQAGMKVIKRRIYAALLEMRVCADEPAVSWRTRPASSVSAKLQFTVDGQPVTKELETGPRQRFVAGRRVSSSLVTLWTPAERRLDSSSVEWIDVSYPESALLIFGFRIDW